jgi:putative MATE family efflux protein
MSSIIITILGIAFSREIFVMIKLPEEIIPKATTYFRIFVGGFILMFGYNGTNAILRGIGDSKTPLVFLIISTLANIGFDLLFILVFKWGIEGAAAATVISQALTFFLGIAYLNKTHTLIQISFRKFIFDYEIFKKSIKIGIPSGFQQTFVALGMMALFRIVNDFGTNTVAAYSAAVRINSFASMPAMTFAAALSTFVGQNLGANRPDRVKRGFVSTIFMTSIYSITITILILLFRGDLMEVFNPTPGVVEIGKSYLLIVSSFYLIFAYMFVTQGLLRGAGDTLIPMFITIISLWILRIPISYYLSRIMGTDGIWWGVPIAWVAGFVFAFLYYLTGRWKNKVVTKPSYVTGIVDDKEQGVLNKD